MLYIPKIDDKLQILTDEEVKDFEDRILVSILNLQRKLYSKLNKKQSLRKVVKLLCISPKTSHQVEKYVQSYSSDNCTQFYNVEILSLFDPELQLKNVEYTIKNKLKELLSKFKKLKVQKVLVLSYKKSNDCKTFHSSSNLIVSYSDIDKAFISMHQSIATKKNMVIQIALPWMYL